MTDFLNTAASLFDFVTDDKVIVFMPLSHFGQRSYVFAAVMLGLDVVLVAPQDLFGALAGTGPRSSLRSPFFSRAFIASLRIRHSHSVTTLPRRADAADDDRVGANA